MAVRESTIVWRNFALRFSSTASTSCGSRTRTPILSAKREMSAASIVSFFDRHPSALANCRTRRALAYATRTSNLCRKAISGIGRRKVVLVYRCSAAYPDDEVAEHVDTVLHNLFPDSGNPRQEALGIYRMDESDAVVRGEADPAIRPLGEGPDMVGLITGLDIVETRRDSLRSQCEAIVAKTEDAIEAADVRRWELVAYRDSVRALASHAVLGGLKNFPQGLLMEKFAECWRASQPLLVPDKARAFAEASRKGWEWAHKHPEQAVDIVMKVMEREKVPASRRHQEWMLREVLKLQCRKGENVPNFKLDTEKVKELNKLLLYHGSIDKEHNVEQIQGTKLWRK